MTWSACAIRCSCGANVEHVGNLSRLLATPAEVRDALGAALLHGDSLNDLMVVEY